MSRNKDRPFACQVVSETVRIRLTTRRVGGFSGTDEPFVQCDQEDCQYVDQNELPCQLRSDMFNDEVDPGEALDDDDDFT